MKYQHRNYFLVLRRPPFPSQWLDLMETARQASVHPDLLLRMVELGLIEPEQSTPEMLFAQETVATIGKAVRLRCQLGINWAGVGLVLDLLDRIEELEREIERLRKE